MPNFPLNDIPSTIEFGPGTGTVDPAKPWKIPEPSTSLEPTKKPDEIQSFIQRLSGNMPAASPAVQAARAPGIPAQPGWKLEPALYDIYTRWKQDPNPDNSAEMLKAIAPIINTALRAYGGPSSSSPTLRSRAKVEALEALKIYDPAVAPLRGHLLNRLQRLRRTAAKQRQVVTMPEKVALDKMLVDLANKELEDDLGRPPSDQEIADYTGLSMKRLEYIRSGGRPTAESTITSKYDEESQPFDPTVSSIKPSYDSWIEFVYTDLDPTNQFILERIMGLHGHKAMSPGDIARKLKISPAAISHRMKYIQAKLDKRSEYGIL